MLLPVVPVVGSPPLKELEVDRHQLAVCLPDVVVEFILFFVLAPPGLAQRRVNAEQLAAEVTLVALDLVAEFEAQQAQRPTPRPTHKKQTSDGLALEMSKRGIGLELLLKMWTVAVVEVELLVRNALKKNDRQGSGR